MQITHLHEWNISPAEAIAVQQQFRAELDDQRPLDLSAITLVAGVDVSVKPNLQTGLDHSQAAIAVLSFPDLQPVETVLADMPTPFPYIPGLLTFREGPVLETAFAKLQSTPDVFIFDGMGRAHPRRMGIAAHMGLWLQKPTIGCGKTHLIGKYADPADVKGAYSELTDHGEVIGVVLRTRAGVKPVYISVGHRADLATSIELVLRCAPKYRLPEPIRAAHHAAGQFSG